MPSSAVASLREELLAIMDRKDHWAWRHYEDGRADLDQLLIHFRQEYEVYVRDFPILLSRVHSRCPVAGVRQELAENLFEEETGKLSLGVPHPELFLRMMKGLAFPRSQFRDIEMLPEAAAYRTWIDQVTMNRPWIEGAALVTVFIEGSRRDRERVVGEGSGEPSDPVRDSFLARHYGVDPEFLELKRAHAQVEGSHRDAAWSMVVDHAGSGRVAERVVRTVRRALDLWLRYRDGVAAACRIPRPSDRP